MLNNIAGPGSGGCIAADSVYGYWAVSFVVGTR